jgi:hypothetical protein
MTVATTVRAKFRAVSVEQGPNTSDTFAVKLTPVYDDGNAENKEFFTYTPGGEITLQVVRPETAGQFEVGKAYYVDFSPAD